MIRCRNSCPENKFDGCCHECTYQEGCESLCANKPDDCGDAIFEGQSLQVFQSASATVIEAIADIVTQKKALEDQEKTMKEQLQKAMETYGIKSFDNGRIKFTYVDSTSRSSIDTPKLKKLYPSIAEECTKSSPVKAFVKIEIK